MFRKETILPNCKMENNPYYQCILFYINLLLFEYPYIIYFILPSKLSKTRE